MEPGSQDPWEGSTPWMRRRGPRAALALTAAAALLGLTLWSTCSTRTGPPPTTTTTMHAADGVAPGVG